LVFSFKADIEPPDFSAYGKNMRRAAVLCCTLLASVQQIAAETLTARSPCAAPADHTASPDVDAGDVNGRPPPPSLMLELRRTMPTGSDWLLDATLAIVVVDGGGVRIEGPDGATLGAHPTDPACE